jgi:hypothetical protein
MLLRIQEPESRSQEGGTGEIVPVLVVVLPTSPRCLKLREATSGRLSSDLVGRCGVDFADGAEFLVPEGLWRW